MPDKLARTPTRDGGIHITSLNTSKLKEISKTTPGIFRLISCYKGGFQVSKYEIIV